MSHLYKRLSQQLRDRGAYNPDKLARELLIKRGHMTIDGELTPEGLKRQEMGNAGRALDRASRYTGKSVTDFTYDPKTNNTRRRNPRRKKRNIRRMPMR